MTKKQQHKEALVDTQLERAFLASLFINAYATEAMRQLQGIVVEDDFTNEEFAETWKVIASCYNKGKQLSPLNIYSIGKEMGVEVDIKRYLSRESIFADAETLGRTLHALGHGGERMLFETYRGWNTETRFLLNQKNKS